MKHETIKLPEHHPDYPTLWISECESARVIRCNNDIQWIVQKLQGTQWRSLSFQTTWDSIHYRWGYYDAFATLPSVEGERLRL